MDREMFFFSPIFIKPQNGILSLLGKTLPLQPLQKKEDCTNSLQGPFSLTFSEAGNALSPLLLDAVGLLENHTCMAGFVGDLKFRAFRVCLADSGI